MKPLALIVVLVHLMALATGGPGWSQTAGAGSAQATQETADTARRLADIRDRLGAAQSLIEDNKAKAAMALLLPLREALEDEGDPDLLLVLYDLTGYAGARLKDRAAEIRGNVHSVLLNYLTAPLNAPDTVIAELTLAETYRRHDIGTLQFYVLMNVLAAGKPPRGGGALSDDLEETQAMAAALMGQRLQAEDRPELALFFFRRAQALARKGRMDTVNAGKLDTVIGALEAPVAERAGSPLPGPDDCMGTAAPDAARMAACRQAADRAIVTGDAALADKILSNLLNDVPSGSLREERYDAARDLLLLRQLNREDHDRDLLASADLVANYLASIGEATAAALIGARIARTQIDLGTYDPRVVQMCGHIARRALRNGSIELARRMLALQRAATLSGMAEPDAPLSAAAPGLLERRLTAALLQIENARIAATANAPRLAAAEWAAVDRQVATLALDDFDRIEQLTVIHYAGLKDYVFPTYAAAVEFIGRLARRLPGQDPRHDEAILGWISAVEAWWGDSARADAMADEAIGNIRAAPEGRTPALARLLTLRAGIVETSNPALTVRLTREAYEIVASQPGRETDRIELLLDMASDQTDKGLALALVAEAQKLREAAGTVNLPTQVRLDLRRSFMAFDDGDRALALRLGEGAVASLVAAGKADTWAIVEPARNLAGLYAALGRMDDARKTYETYVFPASDPVLVGEEKAISDQLGLANLESYYGPDEKTVRTLSTLLDRARRRVKADRDLGRRILRAQAFAYLGLGDGAKAREAAVDALRTPKPPATDTMSAREDRKLLETLVGADWLGSRSGDKPDADGR
ncbi:hypothetical protein [Xanthobacter autotrophicus]|uniref:hypothetical protein n=1 Tax=Xanthobacter autotrophicus TaxID=280 RepID=UPI0024A76EA3|nr:hypothetical protein [Xanthobacter autotrophicus]MDI4655218.1 hypothetical protein [Xanthobacter autotrophicus]